MSITESSPCSLCITGSDEKAIADVNALIAQGLGRESIAKALPHISKRSIRLHISHTKPTLGAHGRFLTDKPMGGVLPNTSHGNKQGFNVVVDEVAGTGEGTTHALPRGTLVGQENVLRDFGLDPAEWEILSLQRSFWEQSKGLEDGTRDIVQLESIKAKFKAVPANSPVKIETDRKELQKLISKWELRPLELGVSAKNTPTSLTALVADLQLGKSEGGGTEAIIRRVLASTQALAVRLKELRSIGRNVEQVAFLGLGDIVEGCTGFYSMQEWQTDVDARAQRKLAWQLGMKMLYTIAPLVDEVIFTGVAGNHGQNRKDGKAFTTFEDNDDLLMLDIMKDIVDVDNRLHNVKVFLPADPLTSVVNLSGIPVGLVHGNQFRGGTNASAKSEKWWTGQMMGLQPIKDAKILFSGHFHSFDVQEFSENGRTTIQAPSQDGGSYWFTSSSGKSAATGMATMLVGDMNPRGYSDLQIL